MTPITVLSTALLPLAAARALLPRQANFTTTDFGLIAIHSGSAIHLSSINAADSKFWIGKDTQTYCPEIEGLVCPTESYTAFAATSGYSTLGMVCLPFPLPPAFSILPLLLLLTRPPERYRSRRPTGLRHPFRRPRLHPRPLHLFPHGLQLRGIQRHGAEQSLHSRTLGVQRH